MAYRFSTEQTDGGRQLLANITNILMGGVNRSKVFNMHENKLITAVEKTLTYSSPTPSAGKNNLMFLLFVICHVVNPRSLDFGSASPG